MFQLQNINYNLKKVIQILFSITLAMTGKIQNTNFLIVVKIQNNKVSVSHGSVSVFNVGIGIRYFCWHLLSRFGIRYRYFKLSRYLFGISAGPL